MLKKAMIFFTTTIMMLIFTFGTAVVNAASSSNKSENEAEAFFMACDLNEDGALNVIDLLIARRTKNNSFVEAIIKFLTKKPIDFAKDFPHETGPAISLMDLRTSTDITRGELVEKMVNANSTTIDLEDDNTISIICQFDNADECFKLYAISLKESKRKSSKGYTSFSSHGITLCTDNHDIIYYVLDGDTSFPIKLNG